MISNLLKPVLEQREKREHKSSPLETSNCKAVYLGHDSMYNYQPCLTPNYSCDIDTDYGVGVQGIKPNMLRPM